MAYDNTNSGALFKNDKKTTPNHPDYTGTLNVAGVDHWLSAWVKEAKSGTKYLSVSLGKAKDKQSQKPVATADDDSIPF